MTGERTATTGIALLLAFALGVVGVNLAAPGPSPGPAAADRGDGPAANALAPLFHMGTLVQPSAGPATMSGPVGEPPLPPGQVRVCGLGAVSASMDDPTGLRGIGADARVIMHSRLRRHFAAHASERVRAAGMVLDLAVLRTDAAGAARARQAACEADDKACELRVEAAATAAADASGVALVRRLSRLAMGTADPFVYAAALQACTLGNPADTADHCGMLNLYRWVQLDSGNAAPWLALASASQAGGDTAALDDALYHVAHATRVDAYWGTLPHVLMQALPDGEPQLTRTLLTVDAWSAQTVLALPVYQVVARQCGPESLNDANRRQVCDGIAHVLTERGRSTFDVNVGVSLGQQLGWPSERTQALQAEREALAAMAPRLADAGGVSCDSVQRFSRAAELMSQVGELASYRQLALQQGVSVEEMVQVLRPRAMAPIPAP